MIFSLTRDAEWTEKLEEYFEETRADFKIFGSEEEFSATTQEFNIGFVETSCVKNAFRYKSSKLFKLGAGDYPGLSFLARIDLDDDPTKLNSKILGGLGELDRSFSILLVDDEKDCRDFLKTHWESRAQPKTTVALASNGHEALEVFACVHPDIVIFDLKMPGLSGSGLYHELRRRDKVTPALVLSAVADYEEIRQLRKSGNPVCVEKSSSESMPEPLLLRALKLRVFGSRDLR